MTEIEIRRAMNIVGNAVGPEPEEVGVTLSLNQLRMPPELSMTLCAGARVKLTDVAQVDISLAHNASQEKLAIVQTHAGETYAVALRDIYALGLNRI